MIFVEAYRRIDRQCEAAGKFPSKRFKMENSMGFPASQSSVKGQRSPRSPHGPPPQFPDARLKVLRHYFHSQRDAEVKKSRRANRRWYWGSRLAETESGRWRQRCCRRPMAANSAKTVGINLRGVLRETDRRGPARSMPHPTNDLEETINQVTGRKGTSC